MTPEPAPIQLQGFNNLTKSLSFNGYNIAYTPDAEHRTAWQQHIAERYSCDRLTQILSAVAAMLDASILNIARQTYHPQGASVTMLVAEQSITGSDGKTAGKAVAKDAMQPTQENVVMHLDKSHLTVHTYPESDPVSGISTVRVDIDVSTCGCILPLNAVNYLISGLESDIVIADYRVRGFIRDSNSNKHFTDHKIKSIQDFVASDVLRRYRRRDVNLRQALIFHTRMVRGTFHVEDYLFGQRVSAYSAVTLRQIKQGVSEEMIELFNGMSVPDERA